MPASEVSAQAGRAVIYVNSYYLMFYEIIFRQIYCSFASDDGPINSAIAATPFHVTEPGTIVQMQSANTTH